MSWGDSILHLKSSCVCNVHWYSVGHLFLARQRHSETYDCRERLQCTPREVRKGREFWSRSLPREGLLMHEGGAYVMYSEPQLSRKDFAKAYFEA